MIKKELVGSQIYSKELGINVEVCDANCELLKSIKANVFESDKPGKSAKQHGSTDTEGKDDTK